MFGKSAGRFYCFGLFAMLCLFPVASEETSGVKTSTDLNLIAATTMQLKLRLIETVTVPFLAADNALMKDNSIAFKFGAEISPVSVNGTFETVWTPIGFLQLVSGGSVGSAWNIPMGNGLRMNDRDGAHDSDLNGEAFAGMVWSAKAGGAFQFDLAAIRPGKWYHIVFRTYHAVQYRALTSAEKGESWLYESDDGENQNGWNYYGNYFFGYQMPLVVDTVGLFAEAERYLYDSPDGELWGDDLIRWTFGPVVNFKPRKNLSVSLLLQWRTLRNFTDATEDYEYYQDRILDDSDPSRIEFFRAAANVTLKLK